MTRGRTGGAIAVLAALTAGVWALSRGVSPAAPRKIPTTHVQRGRVQVMVYTTGELRAARTAQLAVPPMGGQLQIVKLAAPGDAVKSGDIVVEFDPAEQEFNLEQARFDLSLAEQEIVKADAQAAVQVAEDDVAVLHGRYDVRRAELEAQKNEIISDVQGKQNLLLLDEARQRLTQLEADQKTHRTTSHASADGLREKRNKAQLAVQVAERNIDSLTVRAPFDGYVTIRTNFQAFGGIVFSAASMPEFRVGDATFAGQPVADVIDTSQVEVTAKLSERDRANVAAGQSVEVTVDALPDARLRGSVRAVSGVASRSMFDAGTRQFDITFDVGGQGTVRPGVSAAIAIAGSIFDNVLYVPRTAVFDAAGKSTVYVRTPGGFDAREIRVRAWTDSVAIIENVDPSAEIALVNPNAPADAPAALSGTGGAAAGIAMTGATPPRTWTSTAALWVPDVGRSVDNLLLHKLRTLLTMLGMIFGVAAVLAMLSIGAGAQQQVMAFIEGLGVRNLIVEARETTEWQALQKVRQQSPGLTFQDIRAMQATVPGLEMLSARKRFTPTQVVPKPQAELPVVYGVDPNYQQIAGLRVAAGRFFTADEAAHARAVCVLGEAARVRLFGLADPLGRYVKVNEQWFEVIGVAGPQAAAQRDVAGLPGEDRNNLLYVPTGAAMFRLEDTYSSLRDEIDGVYLRLKPDADVSGAAATARGILSASHRGADDYTLVVPAELLAEQQRTKRIFDIVMVALASISLLVGGIGIMNIMLASVLERTPEIGLRRAIGARQTDIVRQFVIETTLIAVGGGTLGLMLGAAMSRLIAGFAGWSTIVTSGSLLLAFSVSVLIGLVFGVYPAMKAARLDPVQALHYE